MSKPSKLVGRKFYQRDTLQVAQALLGCFLVRKIGNRTIRGRIVEVEAYAGEDDLASHASKGRTPRTELMYGEAGRAYIYMIYGMYHCLNVVTEKEDYPAAVLIRSVEIEGVEKKKTDGPGKLCRFLEIDRKLNGHDLTAGDKLWVEKGERIPPAGIMKAKRIGIDYAKHCREYLWRFYVGRKITPIRLLGGKNHRNH